MNELNQEVLFKQAELDHQRLLTDTAKARLARSVLTTTPRLWDTIALTTGSWLIKLGNNLKEQGSCTQLTEKHV
jgi:uncharacterized membrane protein SirB2